MNESETSPPSAAAVPLTAGAGGGAGDTDPASAAAPPSRRSALLRTGFIVAVLFVVFVIILPRYVDYQEVLEAFQALTLPQIVRDDGAGRDRLVRQRPALLCAHRRACPRSAA